jgi:hypothetical protein
MVYLSREEMNELNNRARKAGLKPYEYADQAFCRLIERIEGGETRPLRWSGRRDTRTGLRFHRSTYERLKMISKDPKVAVPIPVMELASIALTAEE